MGKVSFNALGYKAFCDENRLQIIDQLTLGEHCGCDLLKMVNISQPNLSHHMAILIQSGIVSARKQGKWTYYSLQAEGCHSAVEELKRITTLKESDTPRCEGDK